MPRTIIKGYAAIEEGTIFLFKREVLVAHIPLEEFVDFKIGDYDEVWLSTLDAQRLIAVIDQGGEPKGSA